MRPAAERILRALLDWFKADAATGEVVLGGFDNIAGGKELLEKLAGDKALVILALDPVTFAEPTEGLPEHTRWREQLTLSAMTARRFKQGASPQAARFDDGAWLCARLADFCTALADPRSPEAQALARESIIAVRAVVTDVDYSPGEGSDLADGFISVAGRAEVVVEIARTQEVSWHGA